MIMLLIMGNFKKENLSSSELNWCCFYIKGWLFLFTPFEILYFSVCWEKRRLNHPTLNFADLSWETDVAQIDEVILPF